MRSKFVFIALLSACTLILTGMVVLAKQLFENGNATGAIGVIIGLTAITIAFSVLLRKVYADVKLGLPIQDERSQKIKMHAAGYAYFVSLYVWLILMVFQKYLDRDDILITGLLGMALSFGVSWVIFSKKKGLE